MCSTQLRVQSSVFSVSMADQHTQCPRFFLFNRTARQPFQSRPHNFFTTSLFLFPIKSLAVMFSDCEPRTKVFSHVSPALGWVVACRPAGQKAWFPPDPFLFMM